MKNTILGSIAVIIAVVGAAFVSKSAIVNVTTPAPVVNVAAPKVTVEAAKVNVPASIVNVPQPNLGAVTSNEITEPRFVFGGVELVSAKTRSLVQASTTICALSSPKATSTLMMASVRLLLATSTNITLSNAPTPYASSTKTLITDTITANVQKTIAASSTVNANSVFEPNTYLVLKGDVVSAGSGALGACEAIWATI
ncbi:MAG: hypothetical protein V4469_04395 [Patescibacteria group bacterium]